MLEQCVAVNHTLAQLPISPDAYGLVHLDFHYNNFYVDGGTITAFDFEAYRYAWFVNDLAVALFHAIPLHLAREGRRRQGTRFWLHLLQGYRTVNPLDPAWFPHVPTFLRHREIGRYLKLWRSCNGDVGSLTGLNRDFMTHRKAGTTEHVPFLDIDFTPRA